MARYRNTGGPWRRSGFEVIPSQGEFEATEKEEARIARRPAMRERFLRVENASEEVKMVTMVPPEDPDEEVQGVEPGTWPLRIGPEKYLERYPTGTHAALAKQILEKKE